MPLVRFKIRNELSLGGPELNRSAAVENEEPKAILGAVEVAGIIGILRQLGDLAEFSAEVFNGIQDEVTITASRCQKLTSRVKRIETALSPLEKAVLSQTSHIHFAYTAGCEWHPRIRNGQRHFVQSDLPLFVMETYEQCRDPPPLHLLDRFDINGPGSCLRKYSDPTFFRKELSNPCKVDNVNVERDQAHRKRKKKRLTQRNICRSHSHTVSTSDETNGARHSSLTDERPSTSQSTSTVDMPRSSNMQELFYILNQSHLQEHSDSQEQVQSDFLESSRPRDSITGSGYIEYVINQSPEENLVHGFVCGSSQPADRTSFAGPEGFIEGVDDNIQHRPSEDIPVPFASTISDEKKLRASVINESKFGPGTPDRVKQNQWDFERTYDFFDDVEGKQSIINEENGENKSEQGSEADEFEDARNTIESESESELDGLPPKPNLEHYFGDVSTYCSEDANSDNNDDGSQKTEEDFMDVIVLQEEPVPGHPLLPEDCGNVKISTEEPSSSGPCAIDAILAEKILPDEHLASYPSHAETVGHEKVLPGESIARYPYFPQIFPKDKILPKNYLPKVQSSAEEAVAAHPSFHKVVEGKKVSPEILDSKKYSLPEAESQEQISVEEFVPTERFLTGESVSTCLSVTEAVASGKVLPEEILETHLSLEELPEERLSCEKTASHPSEAASDENISPEVSGYINLSPEEALLKEQVSLDESVGINPCLVEAEVENIWNEEADDATHTSGFEAVSDEQISLEVPYSTKLPVTEAVPQERILVEEFLGIDPCLAEDVPDDKVLPEETFAACMDLAKPVPIEEALEKNSKDRISQEKSVDSIDLSCANAEIDENVSPEAYDSTNLSVAETNRQEPILLEEFVAIDPCLPEAVPDEKVLPEEPLTSCISCTKPAPIGKILPEEPLEVYPSLDEMQEENISQVHEHDDATTYPSSSEPASDEKISPLLGPCSIYPSLDESFLGETTLHEEAVGTNPFVELAVPSELSIPEDPGFTFQSWEEVVSMKKDFPEEPLVTNLSYRDSVPDEKISGSDTGPHNKTLPEGPVSADESLDEDIPSSEVPYFAEAICDGNIPGSEAPCSAETVFDGKISGLETVYDEKIPGLEAPCSTTEVGPHNKIFSEETVAADQSLAKAVFDEKIPGLETPCSVEILCVENISGPAATCSAEAVSNENISGANSPCSTTEVVPQDKTFPEYPVDEVVFDKEISGSETLCSTEAVCDENISGSKDVCSASVVSPHNKTFLEEPVAVYKSFAEAVFDEKISGSEAPSGKTETFPGEPVPTDQSLAEPNPSGNILPKEQPATATYLDLTKGIPDQQVFLDDAALLSFAQAIFDQEFSPQVPEPVNGTSVVESVNMWSNGGLLGLAPSKPPVFAEPSAVDTNKQESPSRAVEDTEKSSLPLVVSDAATSQQQQSNMLFQSNGSFKVFGLSHRLLMAGLRGNSSKDNTRQLDYDTSLLGSPTSSPPVEHMKISLDRTDTSPVSKLKLRIPSQNQYNGENAADMFPSFQLVHSDNDDDDNSDIFCQSSSSSPCVSDNCLSDSELWESDESTKKSLTTSLKQDGERRCIHGDMASLSGSFLDLPCFDSVDHHQSSSSSLEQEQEQVTEYKPSVLDIIRHWPPNQLNSSPR